MARDDEKVPYPSEDRTETVHHPSYKKDVNEAVHVTQLLEEARPKLWTKRMFRLYGILLLGYLCIVLQGYDGSLMGAINAMVRLHFISLEPKQPKLTIIIAAIPAILWTVS